MKEQLNKANKIIEKQKKEIQDLKNQLNSFKNINLSQINNLVNDVNNKNNQINELRQQLGNINLNSNKNKLFADKCVTFISADQSICFAVPCNGDSTFAEVEEKLYKEYPDYRETNNTFLANGKEILRFKTVNENRVGTGKPVMLVKPS